jgi:hypothetical protein
MKVLISGASGLIGRALRRVLTERGDETAALIRHSPRTAGVQWTPSKSLDPAQLAGFDAVVHLAGKNIAGRWTEKFKQEVRDSRVQGTRTLALAAAESFRRAGNPKAFIAASAIGYYGNRGDEVLTEASAPGRGFLPEVCVEWEAAADPARDAGLRVAHMRTGVVLAKDGGALPPLLLPFRLGLGGRIGDGRQYWSWVALEDVAGAYAFALYDENLSGPVNLVAPQPARVSDFVRVLGDVLHRPAMVPIPAFAVRTLLGEMGQTLLLNSARVIPERLKGSGYRFAFPELRGALEGALRG